MWSDRDSVKRSFFLLDSFRAATGTELIPRLNTFADAQALFEAPFVVVAHGTEESPILNYGNLAALELWGVEWNQFTAMPSSDTAPAAHRAERQKALEKVLRDGCVRNYEGLRQTVCGRQFMIQDATIWNVINWWRKSIGIAATFPKPKGTL